MKPPLVRRARRADKNLIVSLTFPPEYTDEQVNSRMQDFGLSGYDVTRSEGSVVAKRSDLKSISNTLSIRLTQDGIVAEVERTDTPAENPKAYVAVTSMTFRAEKFTSEQVQEWLASHKIEAGGVATAEGDGDFVVVRQEVPEGEETRVVEIADGVSVTVVRADAQDIPEGFVAVVNECCYGNWGWGQLDFNAAMADEEFTEVMDDAMYRLRDVLRNILLYSALPLAERKVLAARALDQFGAFTANVLDSLPRTVLVAVARSASTPKEIPVTQKTTEGGAAEQPAATDDNKPVTRSELRQALAEALASLTVKPVERSEGGKDDDTKAAQAPTGTEPAAPAAAAAPAAITRSDLEAVVSEAVKPLLERLQAVEGTTVVRSDAGDAVVQKKEPQKGGEKDVFRGAPVFSGLGIPNRAAAKA